MHKLEKGQSHIQSVQWTGRPKRKHIAEYIGFCHEVNRHLAEVWEVWQHRPGQAPKRAGHIETNPEATS